MRSLFSCIIDRYWFWLNALVVIVSPAVNLSTYFLIFMLKFLVVFMISLLRFICTFTNWVRFRGIRIWFLDVLDCVLQSKANWRFLFKNNMIIAMLRLLWFFRWLGSTNNEAVLYYNIILSIALLLRRLRYL